MQLTGWVNNSADGVHIEISAEEEQAFAFYNNLLQKAPALSRVTQHVINKTATKVFSSFNIIHSTNSPTTDLMLTPDFAMCHQCKEELQEPGNRRYQYPFITCTHCGPRYSITSALPYDRHSTTMQPFKMCRQCEEEYKNISDRRFFSQTNSCPSCEITLKMFTSDGKETAQERSGILKEINQQLISGKILAVKGIGGYLLLCDATNASAIKLLRQRKHRPTKPFAVMFANEEQVNEFALLGSHEKKCLTSSIAPVVLLKTKNDTGLALHDIAPSLKTIGAILPYAPLFEIIAHRFGKPLVATSANISDSPIIYTESDALKNLQGIADFIVTHNRQIVTPQDDSVVQITPQSNIPILIRRSRGIAPSYFKYKTNTPITLLATGALMKSSITIQSKRNTYISQYMGNTHTLEAQESYKKTLFHLLGILQLTPQHILTDKHPGYFSNQLAKELASEYETLVTEVQHHKAHFAAVLAENDLLECMEPVLGVIWDGTGLGDDGQIWGGEFFKYEKHAMQRCYYFDYFPQLLGDKMAKEPRLSALAICSEIMGADRLLENKFTTAEWILYKKILQTGNVLLCSSAGRIFDAVASLLNLCDTQSYEGEAAMYLQTLAESYTHKNGYKINESYFMDGAHYYRLPTTTLFDGIVRDILKNKDTAFIAAKFHYSLIHIVSIIADNLGIRNIACSGGVFQNALLVDMMHQLLSSRYHVFFHKNLSPNDENISFGQMVYYDSNIDCIQAQDSKSVTIKNENICV